MLKGIKKSHSGRSMIEMLGVLAIIGVLSAGGIAGYSTAMENYKVNKFIQMISFAASATERVFTTRKDGTYQEEIPMTMLCKLRILPDEICAKRKGYFGETLEIYLMHSDKGYNTFQAVKATNGENAGFYYPATLVYITFGSAFSVSACAKLMSNPVWQKLGDFVYLSGSTPLGSITSATELPLSIAKATQECKAEMSSSAATFRFYVVLGLK